MSYLDAQASNADRTKALIGVGSFHALLAFGLVAGLAVKFAPPAEDEKDWGPTLDFPVDPPKPVPTPETAPTSEQSQTSIVKVSDTAVSLTQTDNSATLIDETVIEDTVLLPTPVPVPSPKIAPTPVPSPSFTPTAPVPLSGAGNWIRTSDYPAPEIRGEHEGTAHYRLVIGSNGRVNACEITASSGRSRLDKATCRLLKRRARFSPATNGNEANVVGTYSGAVTWQLPK